MKTQTKTQTKKFVSVSTFIAVIALILTAVFILNGCGSAAKLTEYDFGADKVPSVNAVIGEERKVSGVATGTENGVRYKQYTYETETMLEDLWAYYTRLSELGWAAMQDFDLSEGEGEMRLAIESADEGKILIISVAFTPSRYAVRVNKLDGNLTNNS